MKKVIKILIPVILLAGIALMFIPQIQSSVGAVIIFLFLPLFLIYALIILRKEINSQNTTLKSLFLGAVLLNVTFIILHTVVKTLHLPGAGIFLIISAALCIITLAAGMIYVFKNRNNRNITFAYEMILLLFPALIFLWHNFPFNTTPNLNERYAEQVTQANHSLEKIIAEVEYPSCINNDIENVRQIKKQIITHSGGLHPDGTLANFNFKVVKPESEINYLNNLRISQGIKNLLNKSKNAGEYLLVLTQIESELILQSCIKQ